MNAWQLVELSGVRGPPSRSRRDHHSEEEIAFAGICRDSPMGSSTGSRAMDATFGLA